MGRKKSKFRSKPENGTEIEKAVASAPPWIALPEDITANILKRLGAQEILQTAQMVCTTWRKVSQDPSMWRVIFWKNGNSYDAAFYKMCRYTMDRSQGQLLDLSISVFLRDKLMNYIADRASHLRRLRLERCLDISSHAVTQSVKKLPHLEELHLYCVPFFEVRYIESIGKSCPLLKSFTLRQSYRGLYPQDVDYDEFVASFSHASAIAKTMPNLVHLRVVGLWMKGEGLEAILNGCPHLESLDIRKCNHLVNDVVGAELSKRCLKQVKHVRSVFEELSDSDFDSDSDSDSDEFDSDNSGYNDVLRREDSDDGASVSSRDYDDYDALLTEVGSSRSSVDSDDDDELLTDDGSSGSSGDSDDDDARAPGNGIYLL